MFGETPKKGAYVLQRECASQSGSPGAPWAASSNLATSRYTYSIDAILFAGLLQLPLSEHRAGRERMLKKLQILARSACPAKVFAGVQ